LVRVSEWRYALKRWSGGLAMGLGVRVIFNGVAA